ncbi:MAG: aminotransferase class V-fold PLP-dependent enzyme [Planctomycetota bacterium]|nr:aminotransferase class V-fold PLP-dependent enzyme [Planctomycetota bacterium]
MPPQIDRRRFLGSVLLPAATVAAAPALRPHRARAALERLADRAGSPREVARDESFWHTVGEAFTVDREHINFNNGGVSPAPAVVQESLARHLAFANRSPAHNMWRVQLPEREAVRADLADTFGCDAEEIAITRNASEGLQICQFGLDLEPGQAVLTTDQDYPRMIATWKQRARREGILLHQLRVPDPALGDDEFVRRFVRAMDRYRPRLVLMCHVINLTGRILPVKAVVAAARERGIELIVDGAHAFGHFPFRQADLDCDYYATSLHKWLFAPFGTGMLYVRRSKIAGLWPLMAAQVSQRDDIRKFEEIGTHPVGLSLAIGEALEFHRLLDPERKLARLIHLRDRWVTRLTVHDRVRIHTPLEPARSAGIANFRIEGVEAGALASHLWRVHRILVCGIGHRDCTGLRVSPSVYSTLEEVDRFCEAVEGVLTSGLPS